MFPRVPRRPPALAAALAFVSLPLAPPAFAAPPNPPPDRPAAAPAPASPDAAALKAAVKDPEARKLYEATGWRRLWTAPLRAELAEALKAGPGQGVDVSKVQALLRPGPDPDQADAQATLAAVTYARALAQGVVDPSSLRNPFAYRLNAPDLTAGLKGALASGGVKAYLLSLPPNSPEYRALAADYQKSIKAAGAYRSPKLPDGPLIHPGDHDPRMPAIRAALAAAAPAPAPRPGPPGRGGDLYDPALVAAVKRYQAQAGLVSDGVIGADTVNALNVGPARRARVLAVNLERLRWMERTPPARRIDVNIAAATLSYVNAGKSEFQAVVVDGEPDKTTPWLAADFKSLTVNPPWVIPHDIQDEVLKKGDAFLRKEDIKRQGDFYVQAAGPKSALGRVKFDVEDPYAIYLHDTSEPKLFTDTDRHLSHGCVRVDHAVDFARRIATEAGKRQEFDADLASGDTKTVALGQAIPVRLYYLTAVAGPKGVTLVPDAYGWDEDLAQALGLGKAPTRPAPPPGATLGP